MKELLSPGFWLLSTVQSHRDKRIMMSMSMSNLFISIKLLSFLIHISHSYARHIISTMLQSTSMISRNYKSKKLKFVWQIYLFRFEQLYQIQARSAACESVKSLWRLCGGWCGVTRRRRCGCWGSPSGSAPCPATAGGRAGGSRSSTASRSRPGIQFILDLLWLLQIYPLESSN